MISKFASKSTHVANAMIDSSIDQLHTCSSMGCGPVCSDLLATGFDWSHDLSAASRSINEVLERFVARWLARREVERAMVER
ncbi:hypothetical protein ACNOYE_13005 [Nannocystaceae bacterium ST9]